HALEGVIEPVPHLITHDPAHTDPAGLGQRLQTRRDVHPLAKDVLALGSHITKVDAHAEPDPPLLGHLGFAVSHPALNLNGTADGIHNARKFCQEAVAGVLYDPAPVLPDLGVDQFSEIRFQAFVGAFFVHSHKAGIRGHIGGKDCGEAADGGHVLPRGKDAFTKCSLKLTVALAPRWAWDLPVCPSLASYTRPPPLSLRH